MHRASKQTRETADGPLDRRGAPSAAVQSQDARTRHGSPHEAVGTPMMRRALGSRRAAPRACARENRSLSRQATHITWVFGPSALTALYLLRSAEAPAIGRRPRPSPASPWRPRPRCGWWRACALSRRVVKVLTERLPPPLSLLERSKPSANPLIYGAPGTIRTSDPQIRSLILYNSLTFLDFP